MSEFDLNDTVTLTATFSVAGSNTDPTTISLEIISPSKSSTTYTYGGGQITRSAAGIFTKNITANERGVWYFRFEGTGSCQATADGTWTVRN